MDMKRTVKTISKIMVGALLLWLALCIAEILIRQMYGGSTYSDYNIIMNTIRFFKHIDKHIFNFKFFMGV